MSSSPTNRTGIFNNSTAESPQPSTIARSDFVVIMAALLCALICVIGLITATRCSCCIFRRGNNISSQGNKGVKKKILRSLPKLNYEDSMKGEVVDCVICLSEFINGDEIRVLPQCGHGFHVGCIDTWLGSHSSCPSCRQILVFSRCQKCGGVPGSSGGEIQSEIEMKAREDDVNQFMP